MRIASAWRRGWGVKRRSDVRVSTAVIRVSASCRHFKELLEELIAIARATRGRDTSYC